MSEKNENKSTWAIGGGLLIGAGVGFFFLEQTAPLIVGCMFEELGLGLLVATILSRIKEVAIRLITAVCVSFPVPQNL